ncbi:MAG: putative glycosyltransferase [Frankiales bacterium]|nr:putative glycosyltransferase [Frankiales bacterium]
MTTVLHYLPRWLPTTEQFVDQLLRHSAARPVVAVRRGVVDLEAFPREPIVRLDRRLRLVPASQERRAVAASLALAIRRYRADVLHVHFGYEVEGVVGAARRAGVPLVVSVHGNDVTSSASRDNPALRYALAEADAVIVPSEFLADHARAAGARTTRVLPSGVDLSQLRPIPFPEGDPQVVFVGRLVEKKGLDVLARAWPTVAAQHPAARLLVLGAGPVPPPEGAEVWSPEPTRRAEQVHEALARAWLVVTPSRTAADGDSESLLLVNLEAQAVGRAVLSTRHGGIASAVSDKTAVLVPEADADALAAALSALLGEPERLRAMGAAGPAVAARFDAALCARRVDDLYAELLA